MIIREDKQADLKKVRDEIGSSRLSFASAERLMKYLNIEPGSVSPLGILNDKECVVPVFFDEDLKEYEYIAVHPNDNTATNLDETYGSFGCYKDAWKSSEFISV